MATYGLPVFRPYGLPAIRSHSIGGLSVLILLLFLQKIDIELNFFGLWNDEIIPK